MIYRNSPEVEPSGEGDSSTPPVWSKAHLLSLNRKFNLDLAPKVSIITSYMKITDLKNLSILPQQITPQRNLLGKY